jgi:hypothetical protein
LQKVLDQLQAGQPQTALWPTPCVPKQTPKPEAVPEIPTRISTGTQTPARTMTAPTPQAPGFIPLTSLVAAQASRALTTQKAVTQQNVSAPQTTVPTEQAKARPTLAPFIPTPFTHTQETNKPTSVPVCTKPDVTGGDTAVFQYCDPIAELVDKLTLLAIKADDSALTPQEKTEYDMLQKRYAVCATNTPELEQLKSQLQAANKQSVLLNKKSTNLQEVKKYLKKKIADLKSELPEHA